ncbi:MAG: sigma-54-dependent Fis family transcriptional regulator [Melioribacteraceae bacterium]|nr:sigma-54-dependent Fis family transcriptional regulator [Melioribacteraceae bacterium]
MSQTNSKILIVDDNEDILFAARLLLKSHAGKIVTEKEPENIPNLIQSDNFDVIFLDMNFTQDMTSGQEGFYWLKKILQLDPASVVILITAYGDVEMAVKAVKEGATDFVLKPWQNEKFLATLSSALRLRESRQELQSLKSRQKQLNELYDEKFHDIIGVSHQMQSVFNTVKKVAKTNANVLITGENGTGKELVARALHRYSERAKDVFISVDMGAISQTLFESELFGHVRGAYTDAKEDRAGRFEIASGGTLFLDEIGNLSIELQSKLLTVIENRQVARVGSNKYNPIDIRLICATNMPISELVKANKFRQDLLYRINTVEINLPPLRERTEDIPLLAEHFLELNKRKYNKPELKYADDTIHKLSIYDWPGNIRELQHAVERAVILSESDVLSVSDFFFKSKTGIGDHDDINTFNLEEIEKNVIKKVLKRHKGNISKAAEELGLTRTSLYRRLEKYGL